MPKTLLEGFQEQLLAGPLATAVVDGERMFSYRHLEDDSDRMAVELQACGVGRDSAVGIYIQRSYEMVVAVVATVKAGACYLPLDPDYPEDRLRFMVADAGLQVLLSSKAMDPRPLAWTGPVLHVDRLLAAGVGTGTPQVHRTSPDDLAYLIYTSGSTGRPKGVAMRHGPLEHLIEWQLRDSTLGAGDRTLQFSPLSFDVSFQEIFATLCSGGCLVTIRNEQRLDGAALLDVIESRKVNRLFLPFIALQYLADAAQQNRHYPDSLREVISAGEALQITRSIEALFTALPNCRLQNQYGPSESHVVTAHTLRGQPGTWPRLPPIGTSLPHVNIQILGDDGEVAEAGDEGEIFLGGNCLARGYLHREDLTAERFVVLGGERFYRTGDLARRHSDGVLEYLGRKDTQVKIRGHRVELGEIEVALGKHPVIAQAVVDVRTGRQGDKRLVAYLKGEPVSVADIRQFLSLSLPDYMQPSIFVAVEDFPRTASGKIDRRSLPPPPGERPPLANRFVEPATSLARSMTALWEELLEVAPVGGTDNFFDLGGNSLLALRFVERMKVGLGINLSPVELFERPTVAELVDAIESNTHCTVKQHASPGQNFSPQRKARPRRMPGGKVAIVGMALRLPGADSPDEYWANLLAGRESIRFFSAADIAAESPNAPVDDSNFVAAKGVIAHPARFDAEFFGVPPREAAVVDPQQRVLLELAWNALEDSGYSPVNLEVQAGPVGVFAGTANNSYFPNNLAKRPEELSKLGTFVAMTGNEKDYVATRIAHKLNLTGPALSVHTACSTSLVAVHQAVQALRAGECELAIAGGASVSAPQCDGYLYQEGGMLSADGHCRPFDARASGTIFSDGAGVVVLKPLEAALRDRDHIYGIIEGSAVNNDGGGKASFSAPSVSGQSEAVLLAQLDAGLQAPDIGYVETHGTATPLGDPIEVKALGEAFSKNAGSESGGGTHCVLGSVKSNFGHLTGAAGIASLIKVALMVERGRIPPTLHFESPNPTIEWDSLPFRVNRKTEEWPEENGKRRIAGVSSFGVGGTNAHLIVSQPPDSDDKKEASRPWQLMILSHRSETGLARGEENFLAALESSPAALSDMAYTLNTGRALFPRITAVIANGPESAARALRERSAPYYRRFAQGTGARRAVFLFPGQGAQMPGMGRILYESEPVFRHSVDRSAAIISGLSGEDIRPLIYADLFPGEADEERLSETLYAQLSLFTVEYALAELWMSWGIRPAALFGHSVGEWVAACVASCLSLKDALRAVYHRGRLMQAQPPGAMLSVQLAEDELILRLPPELEVAAVNSPRACVVGGSFGAVEAFARQCEAQQVPHRRLLTSHAFHSRLMEGALDEFRDCIRELRFAPPQIPFVSCRSGQWIRAEEVASPEYWARQIRSPVQCARAMVTLTEKAPLTLLELGPRSTLSTLFKQNLAVMNAPPPDADALPTLGNEADAEADWLATFGALAALVAGGFSVDWAAFYAFEQRRRVPLPGYPFEGEDYWIESRPETSTTAADFAAPVIDEGMSMSKDRGVLHAQVAELIEEVSGLDLKDLAGTTHFLELGLDSLLLTQVAAELRRKFKVDISFRQLLEDFCNLDAVADYLWEAMSPEQRQACWAEVEPPGIPQPVKTDVVSQQVAGNSLAEVINTQLGIMAQQLEILRSNAVVAPVSSVADTLPQPSLPATEPRQASLEPENGKPQETPRKAFGAQTRIETAQTELPAKVKANLEQFVATYVGRTPGSKQFTRNNRQQLADPRAVSGFNPLVKEMVYPIVVKSSDGCRLLDLDGNEYVDLVNGFGSNFLGHGPDFIKQALHKQIEAGLEIGPQTPLAAEVATLLCELTGMERAAFCNTGSEAVMGAVRLARTVTGRDRIVLFDGAYHGINDEVIVRAGRSHSIPAAAGIPPEAVTNVKVLGYGDEDSLAYIREHGDELAAVLVEPVQSRRPDLQPGRFLTALRAATAESGVALVFDEVITGFRIRPGGAQEYFGIRADLATYGKILGGGMPIGAIAGSRKFMDALDGGYWHYGDDSVPQVGVTYFAGTFVRHPLAMAAAKAALGFLRGQGPQLQRAINETTQELCDAVNQYYRLLGFPFKLKNFGSLFKIWSDESQPLAGLFFYKLRELGVHVWEGRPCFITLAHKEEDVLFLERCFKEAADFMLQNSFVRDGSAGVAGGPEKVSGESGHYRAELHEGLERDSPQSCESASDGLAAGEPPASARPEEDLRLPSTEAQREIWLAAQLDSGANCAFNESLSLRMQGPLQQPALQSALNELLNRHDALRAHFSEDGRHMQMAGDLSSPLEIVDLTGTDTRTAEQHCAELRSRAVAEAFDLHQGPLCRFQLLRLSEMEHLLLITCHHIICDGWSIYMLARELGELYRAELGGPALAPASSFADYVRWELSEDMQAKHASSLNYWRNKLGPSAPFLEWPTDKPRAAIKTYRAMRIDRQLDGVFVARARKLAAAQRVTLTALMIAGFAGYAARLTGREEVLFGLPFAGQLAKEDLELVGHCVNVLPMKIPVAAQQSFSALLKTVQTELRAALQHQYLTFGTLLRSLDVQRDPSRPALISTLFNVDLNSDVSWEFPDLDVELASNPRRFEIFDMNLNVTIDRRGARLECTFNRSLWDEESISARLQEIETFLNGAFAAPENALQDLELIPRAELLLLEDSCTGREQAPKAPHLSRLLDLRRYGGAVAVSCSRELLDYRELDRRANRLANYLLARGVKINDPVGVLLERSSTMLSTLLAIWKAGAAYLPMDPAYPNERLCYMAESAGITLLITEGDLGENLEAFRCGRISVDRDAAAIDRCSDEAPPLHGGPDDAAYVIFTSGSTGKPKGVQVSHGAVINFLSSMAEQPGMSAGDRLLAVTTLSFDIAVLELFLPLLVGARLHIAEREAALDGYRLLSLVREHSITMMQATPSTWRLLLAAGWKGDQEFRVLCGGEVFPPELARELLRASGQVWNLYGPTESTVWSTVHRLNQSDLEGSIPIGRPIANTQCLILDENGQRLPAGIPGELFIGGAGLASGYLHQPVLTAERFLPNPFGKGRLYRTGDRARWRLDGVLECLGRVDNQIKLRGFRIELGEVEAALAAHPQVLECAAAVRHYGDADQRLVAYARLAEGALLNATEMRRYLREFLPEYMIPQLFVEVDALPLTANGKINRGALPDPMRNSPAKAASEVSSETERLLAEIWSDLLKRPQEDVAELFFDVGGHSLLAVDMIARIKERTGARISPLDILLNTLEQLAAKIDGQREASGTGEESGIEEREATAESCTPPVPAREKQGFFGRLLGR